MNRQILNLISRCNDGLYSINRLNTSQLFYKSAAEAAKNGNKQISCIQEISEVEWLPAPSFAFQRFSSNMYHIIKGVDVFSPFGESKILCADGVGYTVAYDTSSHSVLGVPKMNAPKGPMHMVISSIPRTKDHDFSASGCDSDAEVSTDNFVLEHIVNGDHTESLYVMDLSPRNHVPFEVLTFSIEGWIWRPLPPPPFFCNSSYKPTSDFCAVVKGNTIFLSPSVNPEGNFGTYCFNTVTQEWEKAGEWVLPFLGKTESYAPEFGHWFGLSAEEPYHLCAISSLDPPAVKYVWPDFEPPESWSLSDLTLLSLGSGRFCTANSFDVDVDIGVFDETIHTVVILTGVEVVRSDDDQGGGLKMIRHKSKCVADCDLECVI